MQRTIRLGLGAFTALGLLLPAAVAYATGPTLWQSATLRDNQVGWFMSINPGSCTTSKPCSGYVEFAYQDGRLGLKAPIALTYGPKTAKGRSVSMRFGTHSLTGTQASMGDQSLNFPTCYTVLKFVTKKSAVGDCWFQPTAATSVTAMMQSLG